MAGVKGSFSRRVRAFAGELPEVGNNLKKNVAREFLTEVVPATPVDTGQARSNWNTSLGAPNYATRPTEGRSGDRAIQRGIAVIRQAQPGQGIHISNGLPYIERLNSGWSKQAPAGFVERAFDAARRRVSKYAKLRKAYEEKAFGR